MPDFVSFGKVGNFFQKNRVDLFHPGVISLKKPEICFEFDMPMIKNN